MTTYPRDLKNYVQYLSNYSRNTIKLTPYRTTAINSGDVITLDLPNSAMLDLNTLTMHFKGTTTASPSGGAKFPKHIESIISKIVLEINGQTIGSCQNLSDLYNIMYNLQQGSDLKGKRALYQNGKGFPSGISGGTDSAVPFKIHNFLGFLSSVQPSVLDTALLGSCRVHIYLEGGNVLIGEAPATSATYQINSLFFSCDTISIDDGIYYNAKNAYLQSGNVFELPFDNWYSSLYSTGGTYLQSSRFSISTQSLDLVMATFPKSRSFGSNVAANETTGYFQYDASGLVDYQFMINNVAVPQWRPAKEDAYDLTLNCLNLANDTLGGVDEAISSQAVWNSNFWVASIRLDHINTQPDERLISGLNTAGTNCQISFDSTGSGSATNCLLFCKTSATLRVGSGKMVELVL
jgi:hypothetical protein